MSEPEAIDPPSYVRRIGDVIIYDATLARERLVVVLSTRITLNEAMPDWREVMARRDGTAPFDPRVLDLVGNPRRRPERRDSRCATCGEKYRVGAAKCAQCGTHRDGTTKPKGRGGSQAATRATNE